MLESIRRGQRWLTAVLVGAIGLVFVVFFGPWAGQQAPTTTNGAVVELGDLLIDGNDFYRRREQQTRRLREQLGDDFDEKSARAFLDQQVLRELVQQAVLAYSAQEIGIQVTRAEIRRSLRENNLNADGDFDQELIVDLIEREYGSQQIFLETIEREFLAQKMAQLLSSQAQLSEEEVLGRIEHLSEEVRIAYVQLDTAGTLGSSDLDEAEVDAFLAANEPALRKRYEDEIARYTSGDRVRARHILAEVPAGATDEIDTAARARADQAQERIASGEPFADVARDLSDDVGTRESGGDLGLVSREEMAGSIADAAFDLEVGSTSGVVRGARGYHIVMVEEKVPSAVQSFEEVAPELAREGAQLEAAATRANDLANGLSEAIRGGASLEDAARARELTLVRTGGLRRRPDSFIPDLGAAPELLALAFALEPGSSSARVFEIGNRLVLIQVIEHTAIEEAELTAQLAGAREALLLQARNRLLQLWVDAEQQRLEAEGKLRVNAALVIGS
jgi:peptidyl-prolyl cis-trans isomerase D